jgi:hypothetical protein
MRDHDASTKFDVVYRVSEAKEMVNLRLTYACICEVLMVSVSEEESRAYAFSMIELVSPSC